MSPDIGWAHTLYWHKLNTKSHYYANFLTNVPLTVVLTTISGAICDDKFVVSVHIYG